MDEEFNDFIQKCLKHLNLPEYKGSDKDIFRAWGHAKKIERALCIHIDLPEEVINTLLIRGIAEFGTHYETLTDTDPVFNRYKIIVWN